MRSAVFSRLAWVKRARAQFAAQPRQPARDGHRKEPLLPRPPPARHDPHDRPPAVTLRGRATMVERNHTPRFAALLDEHLPGWRATRDALNAEPLAHDEWAGA